MTYGYCSHCGLMINLANLEQHQADEHPGMEIYATLYKPDPELILRNLEAAEQMLRQMLAKPSEE